MADLSDYGAFVETTNIYNYPPKIDTPEFYEFLTHINQNISNIATLLNLKDTGYYELTEFLNGQVFFKDPGLDSLSARTPIHRQVYRKVINFGALPNTATKNVAHNIVFPVAPLTNNYTFTRIYGAASDTTTPAYLPLPYASTVLANNISVDISGANVIITTGANRSNYTISYIVLEYIKS